MADGGASICEVAFANYVGVGGVYEVSGFPDANTGVLLRNSRFRVADITDGTSGTLMVGERPSYPDLAAIGSPGGWQCGAWVYSEVDSALGLPNTKLWCGSQDPLGNSCPGGKQWFQPGRETNGCDAHHYWSKHTGGGNWAFCDGSVHAIAYDIDPTVWGRLCNARDGKDLTFED